MSIEKIKPGDELTQSKNLLEENILILKTLFPEIVRENRIDFELLREILGEEIENEDEYYRFIWAGKEASRREAHKPSTGTLRPAIRDSVNWNDTKNLYIEGDNLEVLKLLQKSYAGKIKVIYIDPPYNTGKDFVYPDNYKDNLRNYQEITGQIDFVGNRLTTNTDSDGRIHSNWLNMMYPRLKLAKNLLKDDGIIFVSIDDNEVHNLKLILNELWGEENFVGELVWKSRQNKDNRNISGLSIDHEYVLCFTKNNQVRTLKGSDRKTEQYSNPDNDKRGPWVSGNMVGLLPQDQRPNCHYDLINPITGINYGKPKMGWRYDKNTMQRLINEGRVLWPENSDGRPRRKVFLNELNSELPNRTSIIGNNLYTRNGTIEFESIFGARYFDFPKPSELLIELINQVTSPTDSDIVLDFFSGSATTAHAVMQLNARDGGNRRHIQIQLPEPIDSNSEAFKAGFRNITELGKERIRKASKIIANDSPVLSGKVDFGFQVFQLDTSNIRGWNGEPDKLEQTLYDAVTNIIESRTEDDVLYEILLKYGLDLTLPVEQKVIEGKKVFNVGLGALFICLGDNLSSKVAEGIGIWKNELNPEICRVIFKDNGFTDVEKTNSVQTLKRFGIDEIKSI